MADKESESFEKKILKEDPAQTVAPPQIKLQQEPIPNPDIKKENGKK